MDHLYGNLLYNSVHNLKKVEIINKKFANIENIMQHYAPLIEDYQDIIYSKPNEGWRKPQEIKASSFEDAMIGDIIREIRKVSKRRI